MTEGVPDRRTILYEVTGHELVATSLAAVSGSRS